MSTTADQGGDEEEVVPFESQYIGNHQHPKHEPYECEECEGPIIIDHNEDKRCFDCGLLTSTPSSREYRSNQWEEWDEERRTNDEYSGWYGEDRLKMVGGFVGAWDFVEDDYLN